MNKREKDLATIKLYVELKAKEKKLNESKKCLESEKGYVQEKYFRNYNNKSKAGHDLFHRGDPNFEGFEIKAQKYKEQFEKDLDFSIKRCSHDYHKVKKTIVPLFCFTLIMIIPIVLYTTFLKNDVYAFANVLFVAMALAIVGMCVFSFKDIKKEEVSSSLGSEIENFADDLDYYVKSYEKGQIEYKEECDKIKEQLEEIEEDLKKCSKIIAYIKEKFEEQGESFSDAGGYFVEYIDGYIMPISSDAVNIKDAMENKKLSLDDAIDYAIQCNVRDEELISKYALCKNCWKYKIGSVTCPMAPKKTCAAYSPKR